MGTDRHLFEGIFCRGIGNCDGSKIPIASDGSIKVAFSAPKSKSIIEIER